MTISEDPDCVCENALSYQDVLLVYNKMSTADSRSQCATEVDFLGKTFCLPVIPSNMGDVINVELAKALSDRDYFYIYHRFGRNGGLFNHHLSTIEFILKANRENWRTISISSGIDTEELAKLLEVMKTNKVHYLTIDVAHAYHQRVKDAVKMIKDSHPNVKLIVGNVMTREAALAIEEWGADAVKVGIGQGSICTTKLKTGFSYPMFSCVRNIAQKYAEWEKDGKFEMVGVQIPIIADGGIQHTGDIAKAIFAGAKMVMCGSLFARCSDSPAYQLNGKKLYHGSTSSEAKSKQTHIEGTTVALSFDMPYMDKFREIKEDLQSSISLGGGTKLSDLTEVNYVTLK